MLMILMLQVDLQIDSPYREICRPISQYEEVCIKQFLIEEYAAWLNGS